MSTRDPLSVRYDRSARRVLEAAIASGTRPRSARIWVASPPAQFRSLDRGGRTINERAFTRSVYWLATKTEPRRWSVRLEWGKITKRSGRWGRWLTVRVFRYREGHRHAAANPATSYVQRPELGTHPGTRLDD